MKAPKPGPNEIVVGRGPILDELRGTLRRGAVLLLEGGEGMGKKTLVRELLRQLESRAPNTLTTSVACYRSTPGQDAYRPVREALERLTTSASGDAEWAKAARRIFTEVAPDLLTLIPGIGAALKLVVKVAVEAGPYLRDEGRSVIIQEQYKRAIVEFAQDDDGVVLIVEDAQWIDGPSCEVLERVARDETDRHLLLLLTYDPNKVMANPAFGGTLNALRNAGARTIVLEPLQAKDVGDLLEKRYGTTFRHDFPEWLTTMCGGNPAIINEYLNWLERQGLIIATPDGRGLAPSITESSELDALPAPPEHETMLKQRILDLAQDDRILLQLGAVQGLRFLSRVLAYAKDKSEDDVLARMTDIAERHGVVTADETDTLLGEVSSVYRFEYALLQKAFAPRGAAEQRRQHRAVADALEQILAEHPESPRMLVHEVAFHYAQAREAAPAALAYARAASWAFRDGAVDEALELGRRALDQAQQVSATHPAVLAQAAVHVLSAWELRFRGGSTGDMQWQRAVLEEGESAAERAADEGLQGQLAFLRGWVELAGGNLGAALASFERALVIAERTGNMLARFVVRSHLGHHLMKKDIERGLTLQREALDLYEREMRTTAIAKEPELQRELVRLHTHIGIGEYDRGNLGEAISRLENAITLAKRLRRPDEEAVAEIFLGQVLTGAGQFDRALQALEYAISAIKDPQPNDWRGYARGLLGKVYLESGRCDEAADALEKARTEMEAANSAELPLLVDLVYADLLVHQGAPSRDPQKAETVLRRLSDAAGRMGHVRTLVAAQSRLSAIALEGGRLDEARSLGEKVLAYLRGGGSPSTLRVEELLHRQAQVLNRSDDAAGAQALMAEARAIVTAKTDTLGSPNERSAFREHVPLNRLLLASGR